MIKKSVKTLIVFVLLAVFCLPFVNLSATKVKASENFKAFKGAEFSIDLGEDLKNSASSNITITSNGTIIYEAGSTKTNNDYLVNVSTTDGKKYANITFFKNGTYNVNVKDTSTSKEKNATIVVGDTAEFITLNYKTFVSADDKKVIEDYKVQEEYKNVIITEEEALDIIDENSLLIVCDTPDKKR